MMEAVRTAAALVVSLLVACPVAGAWQARIAATEADAARLLALAAELVGRNGLDRAAVERALDVRLAEQQRGRAFTFFFASDVPLGALTLTRIDYREPLPSSPATAGALLALDIEGPCIRRPSIEARFGPLALTDVSRGHSLEEKTVWSRVLPDRTLGFGFPERDPDCLGTVSLQFHSPPGRKGDR